MIHNYHLYLAADLRREFDQYLNRENAEPKESHLPVGQLANTRSGYIFPCLRTS